MQTSILIFLVLASMTAGFCADRPNLDSLVRQLKHADAEQRERAARAIGDIGPKAAPAVQSLVLALKDPDPNVSVAAAYAIGDIGPAAKRAVPALIAALSDNRKASWGSAPGGAATVEGASWFALHEIGAHSAKSIAPFLESKSSEHRALAAWVISAGGENAKPYVPQVVALLDDDTKQVRYSAVDALGEIKTSPEVTVPALITVLKSDDVNSRIRAARSLSKHGNAASNAVGALAEQLRHDDSTLKGFAAYALGHIGTSARPAVPELRRLAHDDDPVFNNLVPEHGMADRVQEWARAALQRIEESTTPNNR